MSFLSGFVSEPNHHHTLRKRLFKRQKHSTDFIYGCAYIFGILLFILALFQLLITLLLNVSPGASHFDVYSRNASSVVCLVLIGIFLIKWYLFNVRPQKSVKRLIFFKVITIATASLCMVKGLLSVYYLYGQASHGIYSVIYYAGEVVVWCAISYYFFVYVMTKLSKQHRLSTKKYKATVYLLALVCILKTATAFIYTLFNYRPHVFPWVYYLCDTIVWAMLSIFFMSYASSSLVSMSIHKQNYHKVDEEMAKAMERVGQRSSDSPVLAHRHHRQRR